MSITPSRRSVLALVALSLAASPATAQMGFPGGARPTVLTSP